MSTQDFWPGSEDDPREDVQLERRGRVPNDLIQANLDAALQELYYRFRDKKQRDKMTTPAVARIIKDLAGLQLAKAKPVEAKVSRTQIFPILALVEKVGDPRRQLEVLRAALPGAEHPEEIEAAIIELETGNANGGG